MSNPKTIFIKLKLATLTGMWGMLPFAVVAQTNGPVTLSSPNTTGIYSSNASITLNPGFTSTVPFSAAIQAIDCIPLTTIPSINENYVITNIPRISGIVSDSQLGNRGTCELMQSIEYVDGLGRPMQNIHVMASPFGKDIVQPIAYDQHGREIKKYLPYVPTTGTIGAYKADALSGAQTTFYQTQSNITGIVLIPTGQVTFSESLPENSPLARTLQEGFPGLNNQINGGHTTTHSYGINTISDGIKMWIAEATRASYATLYPAGSLTKTTIIDENQNATIVFKDKTDRIVSKWVQSGPTLYLITDYIYDELNNLRYVIPPLPQTAGPSGNTVVTIPNSFVETDNICLNFFYAYHYDALNRPIERKNPSQGWHYTVYNTMDQAILSQDAYHRNKNLWSVNKYDALGRVIITGEYYSTSNRNTLQATADGLITNLYDSFTNSSGSFGYSHSSYPDITTGTNNKVIIAHYYDNYDVINNSALNPGSSVFMAPNPAIDSLDKTPRGLAIATLTNVLGSTNYLFSLLHFDKKGRQVKVISQNYLNGNTAYNKYDSEENFYSFDDLNISTARKTYSISAATPQLIINTWMQYDHMNRFLLTKQQFISPSNTGPIVTTSKTEYNELGQLKIKHLQSTSTVSNPDNSTFLQHVDYRYNARGWLIRINDPSSLIDETYSNQVDVFSEQLNYDLNTNNYLITPNYNGNISSVRWQTLLPASISLPQEQKGYTYIYDSLNRLTNSSSKAENSGENLYNETISYDELGNILSLNRKNGTSTALNNLSYSYMSGGSRSNQLSSITDSGTEGLTSTYSYDNTGSLIQDSKKTISNIVYNQMGLPQTVTMNSGNKILSYIYDAGGNKLRRTITINNVVAELREYNKGIEYAASIIESIVTLEGRVIPSVSDAYIYEYHAVDHLGNVRALFGDKNNDGKLSKDEVLQVSDYYPFGRDINYSQNLIPNPDNKFKYNNKEYQADFLLYDYGSRFYDAAIGRWGVLDPMAEISRALSPFNYGDNNPIKNIDPNGEAVLFFDNFNSYTVTEKDVYNTYFGLLINEDKRKGKKRSDPRYGPSRLQAAVLSAAAYGDYDGDLLGYRQISPRILNVTYTQETSGFKSRLYEKSVDGVSSIVYATAGTDGFFDADMRNNLSQDFGYSTQYNITARNARYLSIYANENSEVLSFVGHSLGGGLAALNAIITGLNAITFNAAGLSKPTIDRYIKYEVAEKRFKNITAYITLNDPLNSFQLIFHPFVVPAQGEIKFVLPRFTNGHIIKNFLERFKGDK